MIKPLAHHQDEIARAIWAIQIPAYQIEAELIKFNEIPPLHESVRDIQKSDETFIGFWDGGLKGFISYKREEELIDIHRLAVHPNFFRKGIANKLMAFLLSEFPGFKFIVCTGKVNMPAKKLYASFGFVEQKDFEVAPGIWCTELLLTDKKY